MWGSFVQWGKCRDQNMTMFLMLKHSDQVFLLLPLFLFFNVHVRSSSSARRLAAFVSRFS